MQLHANIFRSGNLEHGWCLVAVEGHFGVGEIVTEEQIVLAGEGDRLFEEGEIGDAGSRIVRVVEEHQRSLLCHRFRYRIEIWQKTVLGCERHKMRGSASENG